MNCELSSFDNYLDAFLENVKNVIACEKKELDKLKIDKHLENNISCELKKILGKVGLRCLLLEFQVFNKLNNIEEYDDKEKIKYYREMIWENKSYCQLIFNAYPEMKLIFKNMLESQIIFVTDSEKCPFTDKDYKKYSVLQFERSPLYVRQLPKEAVVEICINYANYLKNSVLENLFQTDHLDDFSELKKVINKTYEHCVCNKEPFSLYICLIRTLQWLNLLGTNDSYYSDKSILMQYMFREKLKDDADKKKNIWNLNKYTQEFVSWDKNKKNLELGNDNDFVRDV